MKRVFAIILIGALMLSLCACRRADPPEETAVAEGAAGKSRVEHREDGSVYLIGEDGTETYLGRRPAEQQNLPAEDAPQQNPPAVQQEEPAAPASLPENRILASGRLCSLRYAGTLPNVRRGNSSIADRKGGIRRRGSEGWKRRNVF